MSEEELIADAKLLTRWQQHKFMLLVALTIAVSLVLVAISLRLYSGSGAMQLDLSRPGYETVRDQVRDTRDFVGFPSSGVLDEKALGEFRTMYNEKLKEATAVESFGGDVLSDRSLGLELPVQ